MSTLAAVEDEVLTVKEAAELLRMSTAWVYENAKAGRLPAFRAGRAIRFTRRTLLSWLEAQRVQVEAKASLGSA